MPVEELIEEETVEQVSEEIEGPKKKPSPSQRPFEELLDELGIPAAVGLVPGQGSSINLNHRFANRENLGGKGLGLLRMKTYESAGSFKVPPFWVIRPIHAKKAEPIIKSLPKQATYAVRSGAPVSMPGMMKTVLGVKFQGLRDAISAVWDSYDSSHAFAYREQNKIDHSIGTAVIIQTFISPKISGVAFTRDPQKPHMKGVYDPRIGYVEGTGDTLVGGELPQQDMDKKHPDYDRVYNAIKVIDAGEGASDIEWVIGLDNQLYIVQHRPLKFIDLDAAEIENAPEQADKVIVGGQSIGHTNKVKVRLTTDINAVGENLALYVKNFTPETYQSMIGKKAMICHVGGYHCHAGIVARESGIPALTNIHENDIANYIGKEVLVDGATGCIYTIKENAVVEELQTLELEHLIPIADRVPRMTLRGRKDSNQLNGGVLAGRFYHTLSDDSLSKEEKDKRIIEIAHVMNTYMFVINVGESRHCGGKTGTKKGADAIVQMKKLGISIPSSASRESVINSMPNVNYEDTITIINAAYDIFMELNWGGGYGGKKWGRIAEVSRDYLTGKLNERLFLDMCFNLKHNNGTMFGKLAWCNVGSLSGLLDVRQTGSIQDFTNILKKQGLYEKSSSKYDLLSASELKTPDVKPIKQIEALTEI